MSDAVCPVADRGHHSSGWGWLIGLWLSLLIAFSPVLFDLAGHLREHAWARTTIIFPWLTWVASRSRMEEGGGQFFLDARRRVWLWLILGIVIELLAIGGGSVRVGRVGFLIAIVGLCHGFGWARWPTIALLLWAVPVPSSLMERLAYPVIESFPALASAAVIPGLGFEMLERVPTWTTASARVSLVMTNPTIAIVVGLSGLGWFRAVAIGADLRGAMLSALTWAILAIPTQFGLLLLGALAFRWTNDPILARLLLGESSWVVVVTVGSALSLGVARKSRGQGSLELLE